MNDEQKMLVIFALVASTAAWAIIYGVDLAVREVERSSVSYLVRK